jgi:ElaA protein
MGRGGGAAVPHGLTISKIEIIDVRSRDLLEQALAFVAVFVHEQGVTEALEIDGRDGDARHLLALRAGVPIGTLRVRWLEVGRVAKIERVAVLAWERRGGVGLALLDAALAFAEVGGAQEARLHAQTIAQAFYAKRGFVAFGPTFEEDGIAHVACGVACRAMLGPDRLDRARARRPAPG